MPVVVGVAPYKFSQAAFMSFSFVLCFDFGFGKVMVVFYYESVDFYTGTLQKLRFRTLLYRIKFFFPASQEKKNLFLLPRDLVPEKKKNEFTQKKREQ